MQYHGKQYTINANIVISYLCVTYAVVIVNHMSDVADNKFAESAVSRDIFTLVFFIKRLLLVPLDMSRKDIKFF